MEKDIWNKWVCLEARSKRSLDLIVGMARYEGSHSSVTNLIKEFTENLCHSTVQRAGVFLVPWEGRGSGFMMHRHLLLDSAVVTIFPAPLESSRQGPEGWLTLDRAGELSSVGQNKESCSLLSRTVQRAFLSGFLWRAWWLLYWMIILEHFHAKWVSESFLFLYFLI